MAASGVRTVMGEEGGQRRDTYLDSVGELRSLSEPELISKYDARVDRANMAPISVRNRELRRAQVYMDELARREAERQGKRMEALTRSMPILAWVGVDVAIVGVFLPLLTLLS